MNTSKILLAIILATSLVFSSGCELLKESFKQPEQVGSLVQNTVYMGLFIAFDQIEETDNLKEYLKAISVAIENIALNETFDPVSVKNALQQVSIKELRDKYADLIIPVVFSTYQSFFESHVKNAIDGDAMAKEILNGIKVGIDLAIQ